MKKNQRIEIENSKTGNFNNQNTEMNFEISINKNEISNIKNLIFKERKFHKSKCEIQ